jgi:phospholipase/carboxylesterase
MNRLEQWLKSAAMVLESEPETSETLVLRSRGLQSPEKSLEQAPPRREAIRFFLPEHYEKGYAYPLVVWLHGAGESEDKLDEVLPELSLRNYVGVAPRGTDLPEFGPGYRWCDSADGIERASECVHAAIDYAAARANVAPQKVFLAGRGEGGAMALRLALSNPESYCGVLSFQRGIPRGQNLLGRLKQARSLPIFLAVGTESLEYPTSQLCDDLRLSHLAWLSVCVKQYHPCADELIVDMMSDANEWMMNLVTGGARTSVR